jgi:putative phosphoribosyl transferase
MFFRNRTDAGVQLADRLKAEHLKSPIIIALPRGGVPVAHEVSLALKAPMDMLMVRKLGAPGNPEYGFGAVTEEDFYWVDSETTQRLGITDLELKRKVVEKSREVRDWATRYRGGRPMADVSAKNVLLIDDGLATGVSAVVAAQYLRQLGAAEIILAVPVASPESVRAIRAHFDKVVCVHAPASFRSVGSWYHDFSEVTDREVARMLDRNTGPQEKTVSEKITINTGEADLPGDLEIPARPLGLVIFAHGSGSSRLSPRNRQVAKILNEAEIATFLFDLLTPEESENRSNVFDTVLLGRRLVTTTRFLIREPRFARLPLGFFGASTGGGAALWAAAEMGDKIAAVVSRGGRPDLARPRLSEVVSPTLLVVGEKDPAVLRLNQDALKQLQYGELVVVPRATHLFEEPGALDQAARHSSWWFVQAFKQYARKHVA